MPYETTRSYINRLAEANHLAAADFYTEILGHRGLARREVVLNPEAQWRLAQISGRPLPELRRALPSLGIAHEIGNPSPRVMALTPATRAITPACRRCTVLHGGPVAAQLIPPEHINMCHLHHAWLRGVPNPLDTSNRPEIARAQRRHIRLAHRRLFGLPDALATARSLMYEWSSKHRVLNHRINSRDAAITGHNKIHPSSMPSEIARYPELIVIAGLLVDHPDWPPAPPIWDMFPIDSRNIEITAALFAGLHIVFDPASRQAEITAVAHQTHGANGRSVRAAEARRRKIANRTAYEAHHDPAPREDLSWLYQLARRKHYETRGLPTASA